MYNAPVPEVSSLSSSMPLSFSMTGWASRRSLGRPVMMFCLATLLAGPAAAQNAVPGTAAAGAATGGAAIDDEAGASPQTGDVLVAETMVISATRTERPRFTTPSAISVIDTTTIEDIQPYGYQEIFDTVPGVEIQGGARRIAEEPNIRGFLDDQVVIRIDGARQNFDLAHRGRFFADPDLISRIEVLRGSASALYGSGALGGVISLRTKGARDFLDDGESFGVRGRVGYMTNGDEVFTSVGAFGQVGNFDGFANFVYRETFEDLKDGDGNPILDSRDRVLNGLVKVGIEPVDHHRLEIIADIYDNDGRNPTNANDESSPTTVVNRDTQQRGLRMNYTYDDPSNRWVNFRAVAFYTDIDITEDRIFDGRLDESDYESYGLDLYNTSTLFNGDTMNLKLTYGFEFFEDRQSGTRNGADRIQFPDAKRSFVAAYAQAELLLWDVVSLIPGLRWDSYDLNSEGVFPDRDEDEISPKVAVGVEATENVYLWASYAEAFRAPSLTQLYSDGVHFAVPLGPNEIVVNEFVPAPNLLPERARTFEIGARFRQENLFSQNDLLEFSATYFHSDIDDYIDQAVIFISGPPTFTPPFGPLVFPGTTTSFNTDARIKGAELELSYDSRYVFLALAGSLADGKNKLTDVGLVNVPPDRLTIRLEGKVPSQGIRFGTRVTIAGSKTDVPADNVTTPAYETIDLFARWNPVEGPLRGLSFTVGVDNVTDETYFILPTAIRQPGISGRFSVGFKFSS